VIVCGKERNVKRRKVHIKIKLMGKTTTSSFLAFTQMTLSRRLAEASCVIAFSPT